MRRDGGKNFIEELQSQSESTKKKILVAATIVSMVVIVYLWLACFNNIMSNASPAVAQQGAPSASMGDGGGAWSAFSGAVAGFWQAARDGVKSISGAVGSARQYNVNPRQ